VKELLRTLGTSVDRAAVLKALGTWVDLGVLKERGDEGTYVLLEEAEEGGTRAAGPRAGESPVGYGYPRNSRLIWVCLFISSGRGTTVCDDRAAAAG